MGSTRGQAATVAAVLPGIDEERVGAWLAEHVAGSAPPFAFELIAGGHSNLTFKATDANGWRLVVRRPPLGHVLATAHDMGREHRVIAALGPTPVPVAPTFGLCEDEAVNGAPFYVMEFVDGIVLDSPGQVGRPQPRRAPGGSPGDDLIDILAALHAVDVDAVGLGDLARRDGYIERQLKRWTKQWEASKTRDLPAIEEVQRRLVARVPEQHGTAIVHGDYRLGNCLVDPLSGEDHRRARLGAVHPRRSARRRRLPVHLLDRSGSAPSPAERPDVGRRLPLT